MLEQQHGPRTPCYSKMLMLWIREQTFSFAFEILTTERIAVFCCWMLQSSRLENVCWQETFDAKAGSGRCWESAVSSRWIGLSFHNR